MFRSSSRALSVVLSATLLCPRAYAVSPEESSSNAGLAFDLGSAGRSGAFAQLQESAGVPAAKRKESGQPAFGLKLGLRADSLRSVPAPKADAAPKKAGWFKRLTSALKGRLGGERGSAGLLPLLAGSAVFGAMTGEGFLLLLFGAGLLGIMFLAGSDSCFAAGTGIQTPSGPRPIESLAVGDEVLSWSVAQKCLVPGKVTRLHRRDVASHFRLAVGTRTILTTSEHPFFRPGFATTKVADLMAGDRLLAKDGSGLAETRLEETRELREGLTVHNITVEPEHNYFANDILVHNK